MSVLVYKSAGARRAWRAPPVVILTLGTHTAVYGDDRQFDMQYDPHSAEIQVNRGSRRSFDDWAIPAVKEVEAVGGKIAALSESSEDKQTVGALFYIRTDGIIQPDYQVEDIPPVSGPPAEEGKVTTTPAGFLVTLGELAAVLRVGI